MQEIEEEKITIGIDKEIWEEFKKYCAVNAFKISKKIELLLKEEIERGPKTKNLIDVFKEIIEKQKEELVSEPIKEEEVSEPVTEKDVVQREEIKPEETEKVESYNDTLETYDIQQPIPDDARAAVNNLRPTASETDNPKMIGSKRAPSIAELVMKRKG